MTLKAAPLNKPLRRLDAGVAEDCFFVKFAKGKVIAVYNGPDGRPDNTMRIESQYFNHETVAVVSNKAVLALAKQANSPT